MIRLESSWQVQKLLAEMIKSQELMLELGGWDEQENDDQKRANIIRLVLWFTISTSQQGFNYRLYVTMSVLSGYRG